VRVRDGGGGWWWGGGNGVEKRVRESAMDGLSDEGSCDGNEWTRGDSGGGGGGGGG